MRTSTIVLLAVALLSTILFATAQSPSRSGAPTQRPPVLIAPNPNNANCQWAYQGAVGPYFWSTNCNSNCAGNAQSPIDILPHLTTPQQNLGFIFANYSDVATNIRFDGKNLVFTPASGGSFGSLTRLPKLNYLRDANRYQFTSARLHVNSEHTIYGMPYSGELHMMHTANINGNVSTIVICVFLRIGRVGSGLLAPVLNQVTNTTRAAGSAFSFNNIRMSWNSSLPRLRENSPRAVNGSYYHYVGSLSTPPCTEKVAHFVFRDPINMTQRQYDTFFAMVGTQSRPLQRLNSRPVLFFNAKTSSATGLRVPFWAKWFF
eukprot:TRINITY_DN1588_c0_g1_i1.p1 TRINITY_DN1588_c0_g1~~TRINITY_DN1588_c0_g1_i1.p1  ORF type:complete len:318 (-),score=60.86 TRINITY_DN1588_c0_g1_i1:110-1063(-)